MGIKKLSQIFVLVFLLFASVSVLGAPCPNGSAWLDELAQAKAEYKKIDENEKYRRGCRAVTATGELSWIGKVEILGTKNVVIHALGDTNTVTRWIKNGRLKSESSKETLVFESRTYGVGYETYNDKAELDGPYSVDGVIGQYKDGKKVGMWRTMTDIAPGFSAQTDASLFDDQGQELEIYKGSAITKKVIRSGNVEVTTNYQLKPNFPLSIVEIEKQNGVQTKKITSIFHPKTGRLWAKVEHYPWSVGSDHETVLISIYDATDTGNLVYHRKNTGGSDGEDSYYDPKTAKVIYWSDWYGHRVSILTEEQRQALDRVTLQAYQVEAHEQSVSSDEFEVVNLVKKYTLGLH